MGKNVTADVGNFGKVTGFEVGDVVEFRGIPFATIPARFRRGERITALPNGSHDATKYGPIPPQNPEDKGRTHEMWLFGEYVKTFWAVESQRTMSEKDCLNLNIVTPKDAIGSSKKLPVLVWIYGGGFVFGSNSKSMYNGVKTVQHSIEWGEPVITVSLNYRLNYFGFLASKELIKDNAAHGGGVGNYGLHDQRLGLEWVQDNIHHFGGDPSRVTIYGESAGSISVNAHIAAGLPLFQQAILQSGVIGTTLGPKPIDREKSQRDFDLLCKRFGLDDKDDQGKVDGLRAVPTDDLIEAIDGLGPIPLFATADDSDLPGGFFTKGKDETGRWCYHPDAPTFLKQVMAGEMENEAIIVTPRLLNLDPSKVLQTLNEALPESLLKIYGLTTAQNTNVTSIHDILSKLIDFKTDELFVAGKARLSRELSKTNVKVYTYSFDRGNPFPGPMNGIAHHALDLEYVFGNFVEGFPGKKDVNLSLGLIRFWVGFANGKAPWADYTTGKSLYITPEGDLEVIPREQITSRRWEAYDLIDKNWDIVRKTGDKLMSGELAMLN